MNIKVFQSKYTSMQTQKTHAFTMQMHANRCKRMQTYAPMIYIISIRISIRIRIKINSRRRRRAYAYV